MLKDLLSQEWVSDPLYQKAYELWMEFYWWTELYDEMICRYRGPSGFACPHPGTEESSKSNQFEYNLRRILHLEMDAAEIPNETRSLANRDALKDHEHKWPIGVPYSPIR